VLQNIQCVTLGYGGKLIQHAQMHWRIYKADVWPKRDNGR